LWQFDVGLYDPSYVTLRLFHEVTRTPDVYRETFWRLLKTSYNAFRPAILQKYDEIEVGTVALPTPFEIIVAAVR